MICTPNLAFSVIVALQCALPLSFLVNFAASFAMYIPRSQASLLTFFLRCALITCASFPAIPLPGSHCLWLPLAIRDRRTNKVHSVLALALRWWGELRCLAATLYLRLQSPYHRRIFLLYSSFYHNSRSDPTLFVNVCIVSHPYRHLSRFYRPPPLRDVIIGLQDPLRGRTQKRSGRTASPST